MISICGWAASAGRRATRGPLWRRSAFRSVMGGWRDFALRDDFRVMWPVGRVPQNEFAEPRAVPRELKDEGQDADDQPADRNASHGAKVAQESAGAAAVAPEARRVHARLHRDAEEAELSAAQSRQGAPDQRLRGDRLHPG